MSPFHKTIEEVQSHALEDIRQVYMKLEKMFGNVPLMSGFHNMRFNFNHPSAVKLNNPRMEIKTIKTNAIVGLHSVQRELNDILGPTPLVEKMRLALYRFSHPERFVGVNYIQE